MRVCRPLAVWLIAGGFGSLASVPGLAQESAIQAEAPATQPALPTAYRINPTDMLVYQVLINTRTGTGPGSSMDRLTRTELAVFDVDSDSLVLYIGVPQDRPATPTPAQAAQPRGAEPAAETIPMKWTRHDLGREFVRQDDGTILFRPSARKIMPYPVLPLPPINSDEGEAFEVTVPDLALGSDKSLRIESRWNLADNGSLSIDGKLQPQIVPGVMPEVAVFNYDVAADAACVKSVTETRRLGGEVPAGDSAGGAAAQRGRRGPAAQNRSVDVKPLTNVVIQLTETKPLGPEQHRVLIGMIQKDVAPAEDVGQSQSVGEAAPRRRAQPNPPAPIPAAPKRHGARGQAQDIRDQANDRSRAFE